MTTRTIVQPALEPLTLEETKVHLREDLVSVSNDAYISTLITVARQTAEHRLQRSLMLQTLQVTLDEFPTHITLANPPVVDVLAVEYTDTEGALITLAPTSYTLDNRSEPGWLVPAYGYTWPATQCSINAVRVMYRAGYSLSADPDTARAAVPAAIKQWMLLAVGDMYARRSASAERPAVRHDFVDSLLDAYRIWSL